MVCVRYLKWWSLWARLGAYHPAWRLRPPSAHRHLGVVHRTATWSCPMKRWLRLLKGKEKSKKCLVLFTDHLWAPTVGLHATFVQTKKQELHEQRSVKTFKRTHGINSHVSIGQNHIDHRKGSACAKNDNQLDPFLSVCLM